MKDVMKVTVWRDDQPTWSYSEEGYLGTHTNEHGDLIVMRTYPHVFEIAAFAAGQWTHFEIGPSDENEKKP